MNYQYYYYHLDSFHIKEIYTGASNVVVVDYLVSNSGYMKVVHHLILVYSYIFNPHYLFVSFSPFFSCSFLPFSKFYPRVIIFYSYLLFLFFSFPFLLFVAMCSSSPHLLSVHFACVHQVNFFSTPVIHRKAKGALLFPP